ncbi:thioredoxin family protein [Anaerobacillus sp. CMMVII]|uniref:thioredoxin family protein n=1 Tax=Anaerobacillus sp. CMMVII TaxID=2755588 RepID=UPI0021B73384|nr:thioredoxin family protein [Anaerobacillus sp. CMMVII]MCT8137328.1 thioredoxin family protein [Anaerobacillus sp. CMMVII]
MKSIESKEMFLQEIASGLSVVMFSANWCPDCVVIKPDLPEIEEQYSDFIFYYADRDQLIDLCGELDIYGIPSFITYHDGKEIDRFVSKERKSKAEIESFLSQSLQKVSK